ncbi:hypothetical protein OSTOST_19656, partial [Ostertagia ostertagi]
IAVGEGGLCEILFGERTHSILIDVSVDQDIREYVKWFFRQAIDAVRLTTTERLKLFKHLDRDKAEKFENALFPRAFVIGKSDWNSTENATMTYRVKNGSPSPSKKNGAVIIIRMHQGKFNMIRCFENVNEKGRTQVFVSCNHRMPHKEPRMLLNRNLPWSWRLLDKEKESENEEPASSQEAELVFKDVNCGLRMVNLLTFDGRELSLTNGYDAPQWLVMKPIYCIAIGVTKEVRVACDSFIRRLNDEESAVNELTYSLEIVDKTWTADYRASDDFDTSEGELSVQGWPR